jgi:hypothetical protein
MAVNCCVQQHIGQYALTFVIFSIFLTDFKRSSISRSVAIFLAFGGIATRLGWDAARAMVLRASILTRSERIKVGKVVNGIDRLLQAAIQLYSESKIAAQHRTHRTHHLLIDYDQNYQKKWHQKNLYSTRH